MQHTVSTYNYTAEWTGFSCRSTPAGWFDDPPPPASNNGNLRETLKRFWGESRTYTGTFLERVEVYFMFLKTLQATSLKPFNMAAGIQQWYE